MERPEVMTEVTSAGDTLVSPVTPLLGITPRENTQLQSRNMPYGIIVNQPKHFLPLAKEAKRITEEIRIKKINEQWAGIP